jgi:hypothetical protein
LKNRIMKKRHITLFTAIAAAAAFASTAQAAPIVTPGDGYEGPYRLAFVTNGEYGAKSQVIADYNTFVSDEAALVSELAALGATWNCIGSTGTVSAKVNTGTDSTGDANDVPIYTTTGLRVADDNADLWDGSIATPVYFGDGTVAGVEGGAQEQTWTGTESDGSSRPVGGDGSYLGAGDGGDGTARYITLARGGYTDGNWIEGPSDHDGTPDNNRTYTKHFMAMSAVISGTTPADPEITSITSLGGGNFELTLKGDPSTSYEFYSSATLDFTLGSTLVPLTVILGGGGGTDVTTDGSGDATVQMPLAGSANFVRAVGP